MRFAIWQFENKIYKINDGHLKCSSCKIGEMRERICQIEIVHPKISLYTPEIAHKIVVTFKSLKIHSLHYLGQILLQQMQLYKFKIYFRTLQQM